MVSVQHDDFRYDPETLSWLKQFELRPVDSHTIQSEISAEQCLRTMDIPAYLEKSLAPTVDTGVALYRLVQLFGTPNVPGMEAGVDQPARERTTWQYLFVVTHDPTESDEGPFQARSSGGQYLLSVYDYKTDLSVGLSVWEASDNKRVALEPAATPLPGTDIPEENFLVALVQLILSSLEHPVSATYRDLWV